MKKFLFAVFILLTSVMSLSLSVTSLASPEWGEDKEIGFSTGLWSYCNNSTCYGYSKEQKVGALFATGFFAFITIFVNFFAFVFAAATLYYVIKNESDGFSFKAATTLVGVNYGVTCLSSLITMCCFTGGYPTLQYGYSYYFGWASFGLSGITSLAMLSARLILWKCSDGEYCQCYKRCCFPNNEDSHKADKVIDSSIYLSNYVSTFN